MKKTYQMFLCQLPIVFLYAEAICKKTGEILVVATALQTTETYHLR